MAKKTIHLTESELKEVISGAVRRVLSEMAKDNLTLREFNRYMNKMGFIYREASGSSRVYFNPQYGDKSAITIHGHNDGDEIDGNALKQVKSVLEDIGWFDDPSNFAKFPFDDWKISRKTVKLNVDTTQQEIKKANELYKNAEVEQVFPMRDSICVLKVSDDKVNLCRSSNDKRPLLPNWFEKFAYDRKTNRIPCLKRNNWETYETECYPIKQDGTLDTENIIIENKGYGKQRL